MAIHYHSSLDANLVVAFGARGRGKKNVHELFTRNENEKDGRIRAERERKKNRTANCSLLALLRVGRASLVIFLVIAAHGIRHPFPRRDQRFCCEKKSRTSPRLPFSLWTSIIDHLASFASEKVGIFEIRDRKLRTRV